ncbi:MAG: DUF763 domain-containing protein [Candidatus Omnitrophota bacterium]|nr:MAG: DUF763 domain-containing protein [Candidatus Omnitrophota bacterium]
MRRAGQIDLPLHTGKAPRWLFERMVSLARCISEVIIIEFGRDYFLQLLSQPLWFQSFGCVLGFDWHSSGVTTTVCGALKEAFKELDDYGVFFCGGKGAASRKTPQEIEKNTQTLLKSPKDLVSASKIVAKVDNNALQDGFTLYHHTFVFSTDFKWIVIQQGMSEDSQGWARRYHWHCDDVASFVNEPHKGIVSDKHFLTLNLVAQESAGLRGIVTELASRKKDENLKDIGSLKEESHKLPARHRVLVRDVNPKYLDKIFLQTYEAKPQDFEKLLSMEGVGAKTLRALALISDLIYSKPVSFRDPARFSFAHGGKDGFPYKINLAHYDNTIETLTKAVQKAKIERTERLKALRRLHRFYNLKDKN